MKVENGKCEEVNFDSMTEQLPADYLDRYVSVQAEIHQEGQCDKSNAARTTYLDRIEMALRESTKSTREIFTYKSVYNNWYFTGWFRL